MDCAHMARALRLAECGRYTAHPNPMVGCVIVQGDEIVGEGWHQRSGGPHAEVNALQAAGEKARGATAYVTLEPCAHHGKTPPCADALIKAGVTRVIAAMEDPFGEVAGRGVRRLKEAGIDVRLGCLQATAAKLIRGFVKRASLGRPLLRLKIAASIDGAIAMENGDSQWITGPQARADVQRLRASSGAIMTGIGTVLDDDPSLNVRIDSVDTNALQPLRVVLDSRLRTPSDAKMLALPGQTLVCCASNEIGNAASDALRKAGAEVMAFGASGCRVSVTPVLQELASRGINEVLVEAGPGLSGHLLENDHVDEIVIYQAPHIMGSETRGMANTPTWTSLTDRRAVEVTDVRRIGSDTRITARFKQTD